MFFLLTLVSSAITCCETLCLLNAKCKSWAQAFFQNAKDKKKVGVKRGLQWEATFLLLLCAVIGSLNCSEVSDTSTENWTTENPVWRMEGVSLLDVSIKTYIRMFSFHGRFNVGRGCGWCIFCMFYECSHFSDFYCLDVKSASDYLYILLLPWRGGTMWPDHSAHWSGIQELNEQIDYQSLRTSEGCEVIKQNKDQYCT